MHCAGIGPPAFILAAEDPGYWPTSQDSGRPAHGLADWAILILWDFGEA
jgi:hypothetical protein